MIGAGEFSWMLRSSSVVERSAVNRLVAGSNPACGANALGRWRGQFVERSIRESAPISEGGGAQPSE